MTESVDVVVIGLGPGGEDVAGQLAEAGLRVVGIEKNLVGGECPYWGCVPSKMMIRAALALGEGGRIPRLAGAASVTPDWAPVAARIRDEATDNWNDKVAVDRFTGKGGIFVRGAGRLDGPGRVTCGERTFEARAVVIATGTAPMVPPIPGLSEVPFWTNHEAIELETLPATITVLGGGAIGVELAHVMSRFGTRVTVVEAAPRLVALEEPEAGATLAKVFAAEGITVRTGARVERVSGGKGAITVHVEGGGDVTSEALLVAVGRRTNLEGLGLESVGLPASPRFLEVNEQMQVKDGLWAVGDVTGKGMFTHIAMYQSRLAVASIQGRSAEAADYSALPRVTFTDPEIGAAGMTEAQARERGIDVRVGHAQVSHSARGWIHGPGNEGFIKLVEDRARGVLVGATTMGPCGGEMLSMLVLAVHAAIPVTRLREMIYAYPTFHRGIEDALRDLGAN